MLLLLWVNVVVGRCPRAIPARDDPRSTLAPVPAAPAQNGRGVVVSKAIGSHRPGSCLGEGSGNRSGVRGMGADGTDVEGGVLGAAGEVSEACVLLRELTSDAASEAG